MSKDEKKEVNTSKKKKIWENLLLLGMKLSI